MKKYDDRVLSNDAYALIHRIKRQILECQKHNIDYDEYVDKDDLYRIIQTLNCCLKNKDNKNIKRREYE